MSQAAEILKKRPDLAVSFAGAEEAPLDRDAALREIVRLMDQWQLAPQELIDPAERQAALGNARRLVDFWRITPGELEGPLPPRPERRSPYRYTHPKTGQTWDGLGQQPAWLRRCLINEGFRLDEVRAPSTVN
jgi:DNA-binding protein H-NS